MNTIEKTDSETDQPYDPVFTFFSTTSMGVLYQLSSSLLSEENKALLDDLIGRAAVELMDIMEHAEATNATIQKIEQWRNQKTSSKQTRVIVKIINKTSHKFKIAQTSLPLSNAQRKSLQLPADRQTAFNSDFYYNYDYPWPKNKIMFNQFVDFIAEDIGFRFDLGLIMSSSFGFLTPTLRPRIKNTVTSIGKSKINCSTKITNRSDEAPYNFEVEITLG